MTNAGIQTTPFKDTANAPYEQDLSFSSGISNFQMPAAIATVAAMNGYVPPATDQAFTYIDMGCGIGITINALASIYPKAQFIGVDFNPQHIEAGRQTATDHDLQNVAFIEGSFSGISAEDLPKADFITMQGIYSWLDDAEAAAARKLVADCLKPGGLFMVEYTSLPGKISVEPLWKLIQSLVPAEENESSFERAKKGVSLTDTLARRGMNYLVSHRPAMQSVNRYMAAAHTGDIRIKHFAHNALAGGFRPRYFNEIYDEMSAAGFHYAGRCQIGQNDLNLCVPAAHIHTFRELKLERKNEELLKDFIRNEQTRQDIFVYQGEKNEKAAAAFLDTNLCVARTHKDAPSQRYVTTDFNERLPLTGPAYDAIIDMTPHGNVSLADIKAKANVAHDDALTAIIRMSQTGDFFITSPEQKNSPAAGNPSGPLKLQNKLNRTLLERACEYLCDCKLVSDRMPEKPLHLSALEALVLKCFLATPSEEDVIKNALQKTRSSNDKIKTLKTVKPSKQINAGDIKDVLSYLKDGKIPLMMNCEVLA